MSTRSELKENVLATKLDVGMAWAMENRSKVLMGIGFVLVAALMASVLIIRKNQERDTYWTQLARAQALMSQKQWPQARESLQLIQSNQPTTMAGIYATYHLGEVAIEEKKYDDAVKSFSTVVDKTAKSPLHPLALSNLGFAQEENKQYSDAALTYKKFLEKHSDHFLAPRIQLSLGRSYYLAGQKTEAKQALGQIIDLYPTSEWAKNARAMLDKI
jgi:TolA-binding protein